MPRYHLVSEWHVAAPVAQTWDVVLLAAEWPSWWPAVRRVERLAEGDGSGVGARLRQHWRSVLPVTLLLDLEIERVERRRALEARVSGDFGGRCGFTFEEVEGGTVVRFVMAVEPTRAWMRLPVPFAGRLVAVVFGATMGAGGKALSRRLEPARTAPVGEPIASGRLSSRAA